MARKLKHSKIKNTSILFEVLTRQIADVCSGKDTNCWYGKEILMKTRS